jgi:hypothetical protein
MIDLKPWMLPVIVTAIVVPVVIGFAVAGPALGVALGFAASAVLVVVAVRQRPGGPIEMAAVTDRRRHVLIVISQELDDPATIDRIKREAEFDRVDSEADVLVMAPAKSGLLDRWATDVEPARAEAQRKLVVSVASLGKAEIPAQATVGDQNVVQAVEDQLRSFPATEVVLVTGSPEEDAEGERAAAELAERLEAPLSRIVLHDG